MISTYVYNIPQRKELIWAGIDLDGTLARPVWPAAGIGLPIYGNVIKLRKLVEHGYKIVIHTSRPSSDYELIESWLDHYTIPYNRIVCGKELCKVYVDDKGVNASADSWLPVQDLEA